MTKSWRLSDVTFSVVMVALAFFAGVAFGRLSSPRFPRFSHPNGAATNLMFDNKTAQLCYATATEKITPFDRLSSTDIDLSAGLVPAQTTVVPLTTLAPPSVSDGSRYDPQSPEFMWKILLHKALVEGVVYDLDYGDNRDFDFKKTPPLQIKAGSFLLCRYLRQQWW